jgi:uncharacterized membrane protein YeaQ/YmgE (transglycosylase-associated protein family)
MFSLSNLVTWIAVGLIGGTLAGRIVTRQKAGFGLLSNLALGCAGALIGGLLFWLFNIWPSLDHVAVSARDILAAVLGSMLVLAGRWLWARRSQDGAKLSGDY